MQLVHELLYCAACNERLSFRGDALHFDIFSRLFKVMHNHDSKPEFSQREISTAPAPVKPDTQYRLSRHNVMCTSCGESFHTDREFGDDCPPCPKCGSLHTESI